MESQGRCDSRASWPGHWDAEDLDAGARRRARPVWWAWWRRSCGVVRACVGRPNGARDDRRAWFNPVPLWSATGRRPPTGRVWAGRGRIDRHQLQANSSLRGRHAPWSQSKAHHMPTLITRTPPHFTPSTARQTSERASAASLGLPTTTMQPPPPSPPPARPRPPRRRGRRGGLALLSLAAWMVALLVVLLAAVGCRGQPTEAVKVRGCIRCRGLGSSGLRRPMHRIDRWVDGRNRAGVGLRRQALAVG